MLTDGEVVRHFAAAPSELGLKPAATVHEENKMINLFPVGLEGMEASFAAGA